MRVGKEQAKGERRKTVPNIKKKDTSVSVLGRIIGVLNISLRINVNIFVKKLLGFLGEDLEKS